RGSLTRQKPVTSPFGVRRWWTASRSRSFWATRTWAGHGCSGYAFGWRVTSWGSTRGPRPDPRHSNERRRPPTTNRIQQRKALSAPHVLDAEGALGDPPLGQGDRPFDTRKKSRRERRRPPAAVQASGQVGDRGLGHVPAPVHQQDVVGPGVTDRRLHVPLPDRGLVEQHRVVRV